MPSSSKVGASGPSTCWAAMRLARKWLGGGGRRGGEACGHGVAASGDQQAGVACAITAAPRSTPGSTRALPMPLSRPRRRRRGCSAPSGGRRRCRSRRGASLRRRRNQAAEVFEGRFDAGAWPLQHLGFDGAALGVVLVQDFGDLGGLARVVGRACGRRGPTPTLPPALTLGPRMKPACHASRLSVSLHRSAKAVMPGLPRLAMILRPLGDQARLGVDQGNHVADGPRLRCRASWESGAERRSFHRPARGLG